METRRLTRSPSGFGLRHRLRRIALVLAIAGSLTSSAYGQVPDFIVGADVSFLPQVEAGGGTFADARGMRDPLAIFLDHGFNLFRVRLWHSPAGGINDLETTRQLARRITEAGGAVFLDIHYSDTWADPGKQAKPAPWAGLSFDVLSDSVFSYTQRVMAALADVGALPAVVQVGNEITSGMLWNDGRVGGSSDTPAQWAKLATLLDRGIEAVRSFETPDARIPVVIHVDRGGDYSGAYWFFNNLRNQGVDYDWIGLSYYPWWHGGYPAFDRTTRLLAANIGKPILLAETAYPWSTGWYDNTNNIVGPSASLIPEYPASPGGQHDFLRAVTQTLQNLPGNLGKGWVYWAPDWIASPRFGSSWENVALFDDDHVWMHEATLTGTATIPEPPNPSSVPSIHPTPAHSLVTITCGTARGAVRIVDVLGRPRDLVDLDDSTASVDVTDWAAGVYFASCEPASGPSPRARAFHVIH